MVESGGGAVFPMVFYDGERELNVGNIRVQPFLDIKTFELMVSQKIGISPNQFSIYMVPINSSKDDRRKIPITGRVNFSLLVRQRDSLILVILKRSRKSRNRKLRRNSVEYGHNGFSSPPLLDNVILRRRNPSEVNLNALNCLQLQSYQTPLYGQISQAELAGMNDRLRSLMIHRQNYAMAMAQPPNFISSNLAANPGPILNPYEDPDAYPEIQGTMTKTAKDSTGSVVCEVCARPEADVATAGFHHCVHDPVVPSGFRAWAGPIAPPVKSSRK